MGILSKIFGDNNESDTLSKEELLEAQVCPNCWGKQEYEGRFVEYVKDSVKSNINNEKLSRKAFVQQFVETNITGIRLKKDGDKFVCNSCNSGEKTISSKAN